MSDDCMSDSQSKCSLDSYENWMSKAAHMRHGDLLRTDTCFELLGHIEWLNIDEPGERKLHLYIPRLGLHPD